MATPVLREAEVVARRPVHAKPGSELAQLQGLLSICLDLSREVAMPDADWVKELVQQARAEFDRNRREQRKTLQQLITDIKDLIKKVARRVSSKEPSAKRARPASVEISSDGGEGSEVRPTALLVAEASGALGILVCVPAAELAGARSTLRATESVEASAEAKPVGLPPQQLPAEPSLSLVVGFPVAEEPTPVSVALATSRSRMVVEGDPLRDRGSECHATASGDLPGRLPVAPPTSAHETSATSKMPLTLGGTAPSMKSLCLCCGGECGVQVCVLCV